MPLWGHLSSFSLGLMSIGRASIWYQEKTGWPGTLCLCGFPLRQATEQSQKTSWLGSRSKIRAVFDLPLRVSQIPWLCSLIASQASHLSPLCPWNSWVCTLVGGWGIRSSWVFPTPCAPLQLTWHLLGAQQTFLRWMTWNECFILANGILSQDFGSSITLESSC